MTRILELKTAEIPDQVKKSKQSWNGNVCINMAASFLHLLKATIMGQDGVWRIRRIKNDNKIEIFKVEETGSGNIIKPTFKQHREKLLAAEIAQKLGDGQAANQRFT